MQSVVLGCTLSYTHISLLETMTEATKGLQALKYHSRNITGKNKFEEKKGNFFMWTHRSHSKL